MILLEFIFQSFWHWIGTVILIGSIGAGIAAVRR